MMIGIHFYKGFGGLSYPPIVWALELLGLAILSFVQITRIYFGYYANRMESKNFCIVFVLLSLLCLLAIVHASFLTTYVLMIEILVGSIIAAINVIEIILCLVACKRFPLQT